MKKLLNVVLIGICLCVGTVWAEEAQPTDAAQPQDVKSLGQWWTKSALAYDPIYPGFLYHIEGQYTVTLVRGNVDVTMHNAQLAVTLRKSIVSSFTSGSYNTNKTEMKVLNRTTEQEAKGAIQIFQVDATKRISGQGGLFWNSDDAAFLEGRTLYFGGAVCKLLQRPMLTWDLGAFVGYEDTSYMNDEIQKLQAGAPEVEPYKSMGAMVRETVSVNIKGGAIGLTETAEYLMYFEDSDYYHWKVAISPHLAISPTTMVFASYEITTDKNTWTQSAVAKASLVDEQRTIFVVGLKVGLP